MSPTARKSGGKSHGLNAILWTVLGGAVVFALLMFVSDYDVLVTSLKNFPVGILFLAAILSLGNYYLRYVKWHWYLARMGQKIRIWPNMLVFLSGFALTVTPGKVGEFIKTFILKQKHEVPYTASTAALLMERFTDVIALVLIACLGFFLKFLHPAAAGASLFLVIASVLLFRNRDIAHWLIRYTARFRRLKRFSKNLEVFYNTGWTLLEVDILSGAIVISIAAWLLEGLGYTLIVRALGFDITLMEGVFIYSAALLGGALTIFLGGLGATEGALVALGVAFGMSRTVSVASAIIVRLMTLWFAVVIGWIVFVFTPGYLRLLRISHVKEGDSEQAQDQMSKIQNPKSTLNDNIER